MSSTPPLSVQWRPRRAELWTGLFLVMMALILFISFSMSVVHPEWKLAEGDPPTVEDLVSAYFLSILMAIAGGFVTWHAKVSEFSIRDGLIKHRRPMLNISIRFEEIERIALGPTGNGAFLLGHGKKMLIPLRIFPAETRAQITQTLRQLLADKPESGWREYELQAAHIAERRQRGSTFVPHCDRWLLSNSLILLLINGTFAIYWPGISSINPQFRGAVAAIIMVFVLLWAPTVFLLSIWELIQHRRNWKVAAAILIAGLAIYVAARPFYAMCDANIRH